MESKFSEQQSLALISEMIVQARNNLQKGSGNTMIFNGTIVSILAMLNVILALVLPNPNQSFWIWTLMIPCSYINRLISKKVNKNTMVRTHIDTIISYTWRGFGYANWTLLGVIFIIGFGMKFYEVFFLINPTILVLTGLAEFVTAKACRFKPYEYGAFIMWVGALPCVLLFWVTDNVVIAQFFILSICMISGFVIPGYLLNKKAKESCLKI